MRSSSCWGPHHPGSSGKAAQVPAAAQCLPHALTLCGSTLSAIFLLFTLQKAQRPAQNISQDILLPAWWALGTLLSPARMLEAWWHFGPIQATNRARLQRAESQWQCQLHAMWMALSGSSEQAWGRRGLLLGLLCVTGTLDMQESKQMLGKHLAHETSA